MNQFSGKFITFEGGEGSGKSTQIKMLLNAMHEAGMEAIRTREPGGSEGAEEIRNLILLGDKNKWDGETEALLFFAARRDHLVRTIWPALKAGVWVVSDRYVDCTRVYQGYGREGDKEGIETLYRFIAGDFESDLTFVLDIPSEVGLGRVMARTQDNWTPDSINRFEKQELEFHKRVREGYLDLARKNPHRFAVIDASKDIESVQAEICKVLRERLGAPLT
ncbi:MAG TPA: dTMP kinase [Rhodospirillaceae bacterium]|nr:MAG: dTMP kinase [Alphaproteobacteria bacterium GWF2_58_20]HAU28738.1 dTMP kinase [Rhodospirillaceae bacterium]